MGVRDWRVAQREDPVIGLFVRYVTNKTRPDVSRLPRGLESQKLLKEFEHLTIRRGRRGVLYRVSKGDIGEKLQLVLPEKFRAQSLKGLHADVCHLGRDKTMQLV